TASPTTPGAADRSSPAQKTAPPGPRKGSRAAARAAPLPAEAASLHPESPEETTTKMRAAPCAPCAASWASDALRFRARIDIPQATQSGKRRGRSPTPPLLPQTREESTSRTAARSGTAETRQERSSIPEASEMILYGRPAQV